MNSRNYASNSIIKKYSNQKTDKKPLYGRIPKLSDDHSTFQRAKANFEDSDDDEPVQIRTFPKRQIPNTISDKKSLSTYTTAEQRYKLLDELDDGCTKESENLGLDRPSLSGSCLDMCPEKERYWKENNDNISIFERDEDENYDHRRAVKDYERCSADKREPLPHDLRPTAILHQTMEYLLAHIVDTAETRPSWRQWFEFLWTRTRSIRKDISQQNLCNETVVGIVETITRFHIFCGARLCEEQVDEFPAHYNEENLKNCLQSLKDMYGDMRSRSGGKGLVGNEAEFWGYMMILNLDKGDVYDDILKLPMELFRSPEIQFAIRVCETLEMNNYVRFFRLLAEADFLTSCLLHRFISQMRLRALRVFCKAFIVSKNTDSTMPLRHIARILSFESLSEAETCCQIAGLVLTETGLVEGHSVVLNGGVRVDALPARRHQRLVENKMRGASLSMVLRGRLVDHTSQSSSPPCPLPSVRMVSFDDDGRYIGGMKLPPPKKVVVIDTVAREDTVKTDANETVANKNIIQSDTRRGLFGTNVVANDSNTDTGAKRDIFNQPNWGTVARKGLFQQESVAYQPNWDTVSKKGLFQQETAASQPNWNTVAKKGLFQLETVASTPSWDTVAKKGLFQQETSDNQPNWDIVPRTGLFQQEAVASQPNWDTIAKKGLFQPEAVAKSDMFNQGSSVVSKSIFNSETVAKAPPMKWEKSLQASNESSPSSSSSSPSIVQIDNVQFAIDPKMTPPMTSSCGKTFLLESEDRQRAVMNIQLALIDEVTMEIAKNVWRGAHDRHREAEAVLSSLETAMVTEIVREAVQTAIIEEAISQFVLEETIAVAKVTIDDINRNETRLKRMCFRAWRMAAIDGARAKRSLIGLRAAVPVAMDDFAACERFRGRVRRVDASGYVPWAARGVVNEEPPSKVVRRSLGMQTETNETVAVEEAVGGRFLALLNEWLVARDLRGLVDPPPDVIIAPYNALIDNLVIDPTLRLPDVPLPGLPVPDWPAYLSSVVATLGVSRNASISIHGETEAVLAAVGLEVGLQVGYHHLRLFPWTRIVKAAVLARLGPMRALPPVPVDRLRNHQGPIFIQSDRLTIDECVREIKEEMKVPLATADGPRDPLPPLRRLAAFRSLLDQVAALEDKVTLCRREAAC